MPLDAPDQISQARPTPIRRNYLFYFNKKLPPQKIVSIQSYISNKERANRTSFKVAFMPSLPNPLKTSELEQSGA